ncbi:MAG: polyprenyl synthetase family protein [Bacteroidales bacterium]|nr:polyprenyl synthetase family protein [Bacteroidales bacterium]HOY37948.1 polyprenyl synthetase family protein [Bacteroidales bacterium]HQP03195.1 polyprenyl synthetase family protein [Bacteroidales bacterium]
MHSFEELHKIINSYFQQYEWAKAPENLYKPIEYSLSLGGKRLRPILTLMSCELFSDNYNKAIDAAAAIEIFHNFTLLHDDIMDKASLRRGIPTVHARWNANIALLSGDAMSIIAYRHISRISYKMNECLDIFNDTALKICEGQQIDMDFEERADVTVDEYLHMITYKTAVLIACSLKIGSLVGGATSDEAEKMYDLGLKLGMAFQLQDDLLDVYGDEKIFGKNIGGDIVANKKTYLLISALNADSKSTRKQLTTAMNEIFLANDDKISKVTDIYNQLGIKELTLKTITAYFSEAIGILNSIPIKENKKIVLRDLILSLKSRSF